MGNWAVVKVRRLVLWRWLRLGGRWLGKLGNCAGGWIA